MRIIAIFFWSLCAIAFVLFTASTIFMPEMPTGQLYSRFVAIFIGFPPYGANSSLNTSELSSNLTDDPPPLILFWNYGNFWGPNEDLNTMEQIGALFKTCPPEIQCEITNNRSLIEESAAVVIRLRSFDWKQLPTNWTRQPDQYFVMVEFESPEQQFVDMSHGREEFFNLTMTYRHDSDVVFPFAYFLPRPLNESMELSMDESYLLQQTTSKKTKLIAWFASNCEPWSKRNLVVQRLEQYLAVDKYGKCGNLSCPKETGTWKSSNACYDMLTRDYKFYLSLENSICKDYITEKFFDILRLTTAIPIVFDRRQILDTMLGDEASANVANTSFIAVDDFRSIEDLANYLRYLDRNRTAYLEYFEWRKQYRVVKNRTRKLPACELCRIVKEKKPRIFTDIQNWWYKSANCHAYN